MGPPRKSGRQSLKPVKFNAAPANANAGSSSIPTSSANSTSAAPATKGKVKNTKKTKARTIVTSEASSSSQYSSSDEDSTGNGLQPQRIGKNRKRSRTGNSTRNHGYRQKIPKWNGNKAIWSSFAEQFRLFIRGINTSWDIRETTFTEEEDIDIYNWLLWAGAESEHNIVYQTICPKHRNKGQAGFKALEKLCLGSKQARTNRNINKFVNIRLGDNTPVSAYASELYKLEEELIGDGVFKAPEEGQPSIIVIFQMSVMPPKYEHVIANVRQRQDIPFPNLEEFIGLLSREEEALSTSKSLRKGYTMLPTSSTAPVVEQAAAFSAPPQQRSNSRSAKRKRKRAAAAAAAATGAPAVAAVSSTTPWGGTRPGPPPPAGRGRARGRGGSVNPPGQFYPRGGGGPPRGRGRGRGNTPGYQHYPSNEDTFSPYQWPSKKGKWCARCRMAGHTTKLCWYGQGN